MPPAEETPRTPAQVGNQYSFKSSAQLEVALDEADKGNWMPLNWFVFEVDVISSGGLASTFYEITWSGRGVD